MNRWFRFALRAAVVVAGLSLIRVSAQSTFTDEILIASSSQQSMVCGTPSVDTISLDIEAGTLSVDIRIPMPAANSNEIGFGIFFGDSTTVQQKMSDPAKYITPMDLVFDPSGTSFSAALTDNCGPAYEAKATLEANTIDDTRTNPTKQIPMIAHMTKCARTRFPDSDVSKVTWESAVSDVGASFDSDVCGLGAATWTITFDVASFTSVSARENNGIVREMSPDDGSTLFTYPFQILVSAVTEKTFQTETMTSAYRFELSRQANVYAAVTVNEDQLTSFASYVLTEFRTEPGDDKSLKIVYKIQLFKQVDDSVAQLGYYQLGTTINIDASTDFQFVTAPSQAIGTSKTGCDYTIEDPPPAKFPVLVTSIEDVFDLPSSQENVSNVQYYMQTITGECTTYINSKTDSTPVTPESTYSIPIRIDVEHYYKDVTKSLLLTNPQSNPVAKLQGTVDIVQDISITYTTPVTGQLMMIPQAKIVPIDIVAWTASDIITAMRTSFTQSDEPRIVNAVSVKTPIAAGVTFSNSDDRSNYELKIVATFVMAISSVNSEFKPYTYTSDAPTDNLADACGILAARDANSLIAYSVFNTAQSTPAYTEGLSNDLRTFLNANENENEFVAPQSIFELNGEVKTDPLIFNYGLQESDGPQNVAVIPFKPEFRLSGGASVDSYTTSICVVTNSVPFIQTARRKQRRLLQATTVDVSNVQNTQMGFTMLSEDYILPIPDPDTNTSSSSASSDGTSTDSTSISVNTVDVDVTVSSYNASRETSDAYSKDDNDETFTNTNNGLSIAAVTLGCTATVFAMVLVGLFIWKSIL